MHQEFLRGQPVVLVKRFFNIDPLTEEGTPENPDVVTWTLLDPNNVQSVYVMNANPEVSNPAEGVFVLSLPPQEPVGNWKWRCASTGTGLIDAEEGAFEVIASGVLEPDDMPKVAVPGPCSGWINGDDVADAGPDLEGIGSDTYLLDDIAYVASDIMYSLSGRQFPGVCERTVRPVSDNCQCGFDAASGLSGAWFWTTAAWYGGFGGWGWYNDCGGRYGCNAVSQVRLAGYPIREIIEVKIGGTVIPEFATMEDGGFRQWRLDERRWLTRMNTPGQPPTINFWPHCQDMSLDDDQPGTFSVKYKWGADVPLLGRMAAAQLARELWLAFHGGKCSLPSRVTKIVRSGITMDRVVPIAQMLRQGSSGIQLLDAFLATYNPNGLKRRSAVYSPDLQRFAPRLGQ